MKFVPKFASRFSYRSALKIRAKSPTLLVVAGVVGLGATSVLAARATLKLDPVLAKHHNARARLGDVKESPTGSKDLVRLYGATTLELGKLYGPTIFVGTCSAVAVLGGHRILTTRHMATMAAYSGLAEQFATYRSRVSNTIGEELERSIYEGAHGQWVEDPDHPGEYKLKAVFPENSEEQGYLRPWFDEANVNWTRDPIVNYNFLKGVQTHMNNMLQIRGHVFLNDVREALHLPRVPEGQIVGWLWNNENGDNYIDFGFMTGQSPHTVAFRNGAERTVRLNFNVDPGMIWNQI